MFLIWSFSMYSAESRFLNKMNTLTDYSPLTEVALSAAAGFSQLHLQIIKLSGREFESLQVLLSSSNAELYVD